MRFDLRKLWRGQASAWGGMSLPGPAAVGRQDILENYSYRGGRLGISGVPHQNGTVRFGTDPRSSALDLNCRLHEVDNVCVVDSSFFVSAAAVNPTLTIIANALRVADHLIDRLAARVPSTSSRKGRS